MTASNSNQFDIILIKDNKVIGANKDADYDRLFNRLDEAFKELKTRDNMSDVVAKLELDSTEEAQAELNKSLTVLSFSSQPGDGNDRISMVQVSQEAFNTKADDIKNMFRQTFRYPDLIEIIM